MYSKAKATDIVIIRIVFIFVFILCFLSFMFVLEVPIMVWAECIVWYSKYSYTYAHQQDM